MNKSNNNSIRVKTADSMNVTGCPVGERRAQRRNKEKEGEGRVEKTKTDSEQ